MTADGLQKEDCRAAPKSPPLPGQRGFSATFWALSNNALLHGLAGAVASLVSMFLLYPFDQIRVMLQVQADPKGPVGAATMHSWLVGQTLAAAAEILQRQGLAGFYRGVFATLQTIGISYFIYFFLYNALKAYLHRDSVHGHHRPKFFDGLPNAVIDMLASSLSGVMNVLITSPLWVAVMRLRFAQDGLPPRGVWEEMWHIWSTEGLQALWNGTWCSLILVTNPILNFVAYDVLKRMLLRRRVSKSVDQDLEAELQFDANATLTAKEAFLVGAGSKAVSTLLTYPLQMAQTLQRAGGPQGLSGEVGLFPLLFNVVRSRGFVALFAGLEAKIWQTVLNAALMFMFYERIVAVVAQSGGLFSTSSLRATKTS
eukprot:TRINITY_DN126071_c0_g1_i1.p1 TRINITY_DN126071_c0_g1~~TRINITY_DN126071_c0_g1_i1.p1  ORF type:complete len:370 (-),score=72.07 TRINITY_DN126071_c0_g1_i1:286-1395(-)